MSQAMETERKEKTGESGLDSSGSGWDMWQEPTYVF
jgi:hypothetical protein